jgi:hypothetical protein
LKRFSGLKLAITCIAKTHIFQILKDPKIGLKHFVALFSKMKKLSTAF